ncbi:MAG: PQQ-dependent sugar dehydrogenase [Polyangiaceae bacterium]|nr:PQQ-dependent sugar dehydrogenase [Polyangiaceae bacterium]
MGGSGGAPPQCTAGTTGELPNLKLTEVVADVDRPVYVTGAPGDTSRLFVVLKTGRIMIVKDGAMLGEPFLDLSAIIESGANERGLLGLAFHPDYDKNGRFFIYFTRKPDGALVVSECARDMASPDKALGACLKDFLTIPHMRTNHNGGMLAFGPDGYLYAGTGDGGGAGDPDENGQNTDSKLGKILRIDVDKYPTPPAGNLTAGDPDIWDWGLRNPWRFSFDRCTGELYIADVGQYLWEEINVEPKGKGLVNYGWNTMEGKHCFDPDTNCDQTGLTLPVTEYAHDDVVMDCSVTGGYVYRGTKIAGLVGTYIYADYCSRRVRTLAFTNGAITKEAEVTQDLDALTLSGGITSFGEDTSGELYLVIDNNQGGGLGKIYRIDAE